MGSNNIPCYHGLSRDSAWRKNQAHLRRVSEAEDASRRAQELFDRTLDRSIRETSITPSEDSWCNQMHAYINASRVKPRVRVLLLPLSDCFIKQLPPKWSERFWFCKLPEGQSKGITMVYKGYKRVPRFMGFYTSGVMLRATKYLFVDTAQLRRIYVLQPGDMVIRINNKLIRIQLV